MKLFRKPSLKKQAADESAVDSEIPPAIACALCGRSSCEGCSSDEETPFSPPERSTLEWENARRSVHARLMETAKASARAPDATFAQMESGSILAALRFAILCELWAVTSFTLPWALGFFLLFPRLSSHMLTTPSVVLLSTSILLTLIFSVVAIHMWWGASLEWGIFRVRRRVNLGAGLRFGLYACGWDLVTSPAGYILVALKDGRSEAWDCFRAGARVPRRAVAAYLGPGRNVPHPERKRVIWTAIWITSAGVLLPALVALASVIYWILTY